MEEGMNLTEQEALKLEGAELDAALARNVMGWTMVLANRAIPTEDEWRDHLHCYQMNCEDWKPSTNIAQAYEAEEMVPEDLDSRKLYGETLREICFSDDSDTATYRVESVKLAVWLIAHATPTQRCRALLLWKIRGGGMNKRQRKAKMKRRIQRELGIYPKPVPSKKRRKPSNAVTIVECEKPKIKLRHAIRNFILIASVVAIFLWAFKLLPY